MLEGGAIFRDPFARAILGAEGCAHADERAADPATRPLRLFIAARSRFAEDAAAAAIARGVRQVVVLGAGLDTFGLRNPHADVRVFEVDHPDTQAWKRARLAEEGLAVPGTLGFVPVDFERDELGAALAASGLAADRPAFFMWLGVVPYLTLDAVLAVLRFVAARAGSEIAFDYYEPPAPDARARVEAFAERLAAAGEPLVTQLAPEELHAALADLGYGEIEDLDVPAIVARYLPGVPVRRGGSHLVRARAR